MKNVLLTWETTGKFFMDKTNVIKNSIGSIISLTNEELAELYNSFELQTLKKNEFFLEAGQVCNYIGFVNYGTMIYFKPMENGDDKTTDFAFEGDWVTVNQSRLNNSPSLISIKAIESTELFVIKQQNLCDLYLKIPKIERLGRILMEQAYLKVVDKNLDFQVLSASERYEKMLSEYPEIFQRVQLYHIANYLGVAPKSLSRIRRELLD